MKRKRHTTDQIIRKLRIGEQMLAEGRDITDVIRHLEISGPTWHRWRTQYGGMKAADAKRPKELQVENARLKKLLAEGRVGQVDAQGAG